MGVFVILAALLVLVGILGVAGSLTVPSLRPGGARDTRVSFARGCSALSPWQVLLQ